MAVEVTLDSEPRRQHVEEFQEAVRDLLGERGPVGLLTSQAAPYFVSPDTIDYMEESSDWFDRVAFVVTSPFQRASIRTFQYATHDPRPTYIAESFDDGLEWLRGDGKQAAMNRRAH